MSRIIKTYKKHICECKCNPYNENVLSNVPCTITLDWHGVSDTIGITNKCDGYPESYTVITLEKARCIYEFYKEFFVKEE